MQEYAVEAALQLSEQFVVALGIRYGFRRRDYSLTWDGGTFVASREVHELHIAIRDGRSFTAQIDDLALARQDTWKYLRDIDEAFRSLSRRKLSRGL